VNSIFPDLDSIFYMSERFYNMLSSCNHGYHPLISKQKSDHSGFSQLLIAKLKEMRRKQWHAPASDATASPIPEGAVRLEVTLSLSDDELRAQVHINPLATLESFESSAPPAPLAAVAGAASVRRGVRRRPGGSPEAPCARGGRRRDSGHQPAQRRDSGHQQAQRTSTWLSRSSRSPRGNHHGDQPAAASEPVVTMRRQRRGRRLRLAPSVVAAGQRV
jgi:hypothetical protein